MLIADYGKLLWKYYWSEIALLFFYFSNKFVSQHSLGDLKKIDKKRIFDKVQSYKMNVDI